MSAKRGKAFKLFSVAAGLPVLGSGMTWSLRSVFIAQAEREGDTAQLMARVECQTCSLHERNRSVWALGQSSYARDNTIALPLLKKHLDLVSECDHARNLCRYELRKAILKIEGKWDLRASLDSRH